MPAIDPCQECGRGTAGVLPGTTILVGINRVPTDDGYLCELCAGYECDECDELIAVDCEVRTLDTGEGFHNYHDTCYDAQKHGPAEYGAETEDDDA